MKRYAFSSALLSISLAAGAAAPADPWTLLPTLPTACYGQQDNFDEALATQSETLSAEISRQTQINEQLDDRVNNLDPAEKQRQIMAYMMKNPQQAAAAMQALQSLGSGAAANAGVEAEGEDEQTQALAVLINRYDAELKAARAPIFEKRNKITAMATDPQFGVLSAQLDQEYVRLCPAWWKGGPFPAWLASYREFLTQDIPRRKEAEAKGNAHYAMFGISAAEFRSTIEMEAVRKYLMRAAEIYGHREDHPFWK
jgi:hypothetical protein